MLSIFSSEQKISAARMVLGWIVGGVAASWLAAHHIIISDDFMGTAAMLLVAMGGGVSELLWKLFTHTEQNTVAKAAAIVFIPDHEQARVGIEVPIRPEVTKPTA